MSTPLSPEDERRRDNIIAAMKDGAVPRAVARLYVNDLYQKAHDASHPFRLTMRWFGSKAEYAWGQFARSERAIAKGDLAINTTITGRRCVGYRVTDDRDGSTVARRGGFS